MSKHNGGRIAAAGALAVVGGLIMVTSGFVNHSFLLTALGLVGQAVTEYFAGIPGLTIDLAISILSFLIALGGFTIAIGGLLIFARRITTGRILIALGGASGLLGFAISFGYSAYRLGLGSAVSTAPYWIGLLFAIAARRIAKGA